MCLCEYGRRGGSAWYVINVDVRAVAASEHRCTAVSACASRCSCAFLVVVDARPSSLGELATLFDVSAGMSAGLASALVDGYINHNYTWTEPLRSSQMANLAKNRSTDGAARAAARDSDLWLPVSPPAVSFAY